MPIEDNRPIYTLCTRFCILVEVFDPFEASFVVCPPIGSWFDSLVEREAALSILVGEVVRALDNKKRQEAPPFAIDVLNRRCPFPIARLDCLASSTSIGACYYYRCADNAYYKAGLVEVVEVAVEDAVLRPYVVYKLKLRANKLWIFAEGSLKVVYAIETRLKFWLLLDELLGLVLADASAVASREKQIGHIFNTSVSGRESSRI